MHVVPKPTYEFGSNTRYDVPIPPDLLALAAEDREPPSTPEGLRDLAHMMSEGSLTDVEWFIPLSGIRPNLSARVVPLVTGHHVAAMVQDIFDRWQARRPAEREGLHLVVGMAADRPGVTVTAVSRQ